MLKSSYGSQMLLKSAKGLPYPKDSQSTSIHTIYMSKCRSNERVKEIEQEKG